MTIFTEVTYTADAYGTRKYETEGILTEEEEKRLEELYNKEERSDAETDEMYELLDMVIGTGDPYDEWEDDIEYYDLVDETFSEVRF